MLEILQHENIKDTLHAYQMAKRCNEKRVMAEYIKWDSRGARINSISSGTADEVANVAELRMSDKGAFITGTDFMCDGDATAS